MMQQWQADGPGEPFELRQAPVPEPAVGQARVKIAACGLNFADTLMLKGQYQEKPPLPIVPGMEVSGWIDAVGPQTDAPPLGTRVAVFAGHGGLSEHMCVPAAACTPLPVGIELKAAAAFQIVFGTAHLALAHRAQLRPGERLVVTGAAGGTGLATVQIGALLGAEVIAIARGAEKLALAKRAGAAHGIDANAQDIRERILALGGAHVVVDTVGPPLWDALFRATNPEGRLFPIGFAGGEVPKITANHLLVKNLSILGFYWGGYLKFAPEALRDSLASILSWIQEGSLAPIVGACFPLTEADRALDLIRKREARGKVVVTME